MRDVRDQMLDSYLEGELTILLLFTSELEQRMDEHCKA